MKDGPCPWALPRCAIAFLYGVFDRVIHASWYEGELFRFFGIELF